MAFDIKKYYAGLDKLFKSGNLVRHRVASKIAAPGEVGVPIGTARAFLKHVNNAYTSALASYGQYSRLARYSDYNEMESMPEISSALNLYAEEVCSGGENDEILKVDSPNIRIKEALQTLFYDVLNIDFNARSWVRNFPVASYTPIPLLNGKTITIKELSQKIKNKEEVWVYSVQDKTHKLVPGKVVWCDKNYTTNTLVKVTLDDGTFVKTAPEHPFILRDGTTKRADELKSQDSLMPFYRKKSNKKTHSIHGYEMIYDPSAGRKYKFTHRIVAHELLQSKFLDEKNSDGRHIHHVDFNKTNNNPENLQILSKEDHRILHQNHCKENLHDNIQVKERRLLSLQRYLRSDERKKNLSDKMKGKFPVNFQNFDYNNSQLFQEHTKKIRKISMFLTDDCVQILLSLIRENGKFISSTEMTKLLSLNSSFRNKFIKDNEKFYSLRAHKNALTKEKLFSVSVLRKMIKNFSGCNYEEFLLKNFDFIVADKVNTLKIVNHKVYDVEVCKEIDDVYCMTVVGPNGEEDRHNFAVCGFDANGVALDSGVFVSNCKYGDQFMLVDHHPDYGVLNVLPMPVNEVEREEGYDKENPTAYRYRWVTQGNRILENWQIIHFRLWGNDNFLPYGSSILEPARRVWRQLILMEDAVMVYRIVRCLHGETKIWTNDGYKKIKDIKVDDKVYSFDNKNNKFILSSVTDWVDNGSQQIYKLNSKHRTLKANATHPILVKNKETGVVDYVEVSKIVPKYHQIVVPYFEDNVSKNIPISLNEKKYEIFAYLSDEGVSLYKEKEYENSKRQMLLECENKYKYPSERIKQFLYRQHDLIKGIPVKVAESICEYFDIPVSCLVKYPIGMFNLDRITLPNNVDAEFARFFGFMLGDGFLTSNYHSVGFASGIDEEINQKYANIFRKYCNKVEFHHDKRNVHQEVGKYYVNSEYFAHIMEDMGFTNSVYTKRIPAWIYQLPKNMKEEFLLGFMDADGWIKKTTTALQAFEIELCNKELIEDIKELCHQIGWNVSSDIRHRVKSAREMKNGNIIKETDSWTIYLSKSAEQNEIYEDVLSVEKTNEFSHVYDIRVDNNLHNFIADGMIVHNSPERRVFYIGVGNVAPQDVPAFVEKAKTQLKRTQIVDSNSGRVDLRYNPMSTDEDYFIPIRGEGDGTRIDTLPGGQFTGDIDDLVYIQNKLFAALKVPKSYLGYEGDINAKSTLSQEDVRFARTIRHIQKMFIAELNKIAVIHLYSMGFRGEDLVNFELSMANPSTIAELQRLELWRTRFEVASLAQQGMFDRYFIYSKLFGLSDDEIEGIEEGKRRDVLFDMDLQSIQSAGQPPPSEESDANSAPAGNASSPEAGLPPPPGEPSNGQQAGLDTAGKDPNKQIAAPNELIKVNTGHKSKSTMPNLFKHSFNLKKTAMDPQRNHSELTRSVKAPFGENTDPEEHLFASRINQLRKFAEDLAQVETLNDKKTKKIISD